MRLPFQGCVVDSLELTLNPLQQISAVPGASPNDGGRWWVSGTDPALRCDWPGSGKPLARGWYLLDFDVEVHKGRLHGPRFYPDYGQGYTLESESVPVDLQVASGESASVRNAILRLIDDVSVLRFDPSVVPCEFTVTPLRLRRIGRSEAARYLLTGVLNKATGATEKLGVLARTVRDLLLGGPRRMADRMYRDYVSRPGAGDSSGYDVWVDYYDTVDEQRLAAARQDLAALVQRPVFSVVIPVYNTPEKWLRRCIESVREQVYPDWEICIADDASTKPHVVKVLQEYAAADRRIKYVVREKNGHISAASNSALALSTGKYVALLDHDDELHPLALLECAKAFEANPDWRMLFTDEDKLDETGQRSDPYFKSNWNPDLFLSQNCVCHLGVYERDLIEDAGGFRIGYEGAQDWDLTLRIAERIRDAQIGHVPKVLYHWRMIEGSTALAPGEKSYAHLAAMRAVQEHLDRVGVRARVEEMPGYSGYYHIAYSLPEPAPLVSLLIPTRDRIDLLDRCITSILEKTDYPNYEIIILDNGSKEARTLTYFERMVADPRVRVIPYPYPFNYSAINNHGARHTHGQVLGLVNNDIEVISVHWLSEMVGHALRPEIGVVGAMLYYPDDTIQHAGVVVGIGGVAGHAYVGHKRGYPGHKHRAGLAQSLSAVTAACAVVRREVFEEMGGLDEDLQVAFNDIDFCLRVRDRGYRNLWTPFAELYHHESASRGYETTPEKIARFKREEAFMKSRWGRVLQQDPYYSPNFTLTDVPFTLAYPPRDV